MKNKIIEKGRTWQNGFKEISIIGHKDEAYNKTEEIKKHDYTYNDLSESEKNIYNGKKLHR